MAGGFICRCRCEGCSFEAEVDNQRALDELMEILDGRGNCTTNRGHDLYQVAPHPD